ncbi:MAG: kynureninase [Bacteroidales bacterium]|nr:kynureninase [Bacteroidales bacterium]
MKTAEYFQNKARLSDAKDSLAHFRYRFENTDNHLIYLDGNSLGRMPLVTTQLMENVIQNQWNDRLIRSWNEHWVDLPKKLAAKIAKIVGAREDEIFVGDNTSVNFYKLAFAALKFQKDRTKIISDNLNFPSDLYLLQGLIENSYTNHQLQILESEDGISMNLENVAAALDDQTALLTLSQVVFKSAFMYDMKEINLLAHKHNALVLWDLSHASGAVPVHLNESNADMAVGCTYKYLNGGPGSPAFLYLRKDMQQSLASPIWGWFGHQKPFTFDLNYQPEPSIWQFAAGTPGILSLAALEPGLDLLLEAGIENLRMKSVAISSFLHEMFENILKPLGYSMASPKNPAQSGSHITLKHPEGFRISQAMIEPKNGSKVIIPDFRTPDNIRLGIAPLYNSFNDIYECVLRLKTIISEKEYLLFDNKMPNVT